MKLPSTQNELFLIFFGGLMSMMVLFGAGMFIVVLLGDDSLGLRMLNIFAGMFSGVLGLGSGYLLGRKNGNGKPTTATTRRDDGNDNGRA